MLELDRRQCARVSAAWLRLTSEDLWSVTDSVHFIRTTVKLGGQFSDKKRKNAVIATKKYSVTHPVKWLDGVVVRAEL